MELTSTAINPVIHRVGVIIVGHNDVLSFVPTPGFMGFVNSSIGDEVLKRT